MLAPASSREPGAGSTAGVDVSEPFGKTSEREREATETEAQRLAGHLGGELALNWVGAA